MFSTVLGELAKQADKREQKAYAEQVRMEDRAYREAKQAEDRAYQKEQAKLQAFESAAGTTASLEFLAEMQRKDRAGELTAPDDYLNEFRSRMEEFQGESAHFVRSFSEAAKGVGTLMQAKALKLQQQTEERTFGAITQAQTLYYDSYDGSSPEDFVQKHQGFITDLQTAGRTDVEAEHMAVATFLSQYGAEAVANPEHAQKLYDGSKVWLKTLKSDSAQKMLKAGYQAYIDTVRQSLENQERREKTAELERRKTAFNKLEAAITRETDPQRVLQQRATWETDDDAFDDLRYAVGDEFAGALLRTSRSHQEYLENKNKPDWAELNAQSNHAAGEWSDRMVRDGQFPSDAELDADARLQPNDRRDLRTQRERCMVAAREGIDKLVLDSVAAFKGRLPKDAAWIGAYRVTDEGVLLDPKVEALIAAKQRQTALETYLSFDPKTEEEKVKRDLAVQNALLKSADEILQHGHLYNFEMSDEVRDLTGPIRPKITGENAVVDLEAYPIHEEDIRKGLFKGRTGKAKVMRLPYGNVSVDYDIKFYESLSEKTRRDIADPLLIRQAVDNYTKRLDSYNNRNRVGQLWNNLTRVSEDPGILDRDVRGKGWYRDSQYTLDLSDRNLAE